MCRNHVLIDLDYISFKVYIRFITCESTWAMIFNCLYLISILVYTAAIHRYAHVTDLFDQATKNWLT